MSLAYYNEIDPRKAAWLHELMWRGLIAPGYVDERSIKDVRPEDLEGYSQCHFFAGIGVWSYALRRTGWPDDREVWTGSCPCQSFSVAGQRKGFADDRHLWPWWHGLTRVARPTVLFGEQVAAAIGKGWLDLVQADLEREAYAVGKAVLGAASVGAPHIRQRLYFVADLPNLRRFGRGASKAGAEPGTVERLERLRDAGELGHLFNKRLEGRKGQPGDNGAQLAAIERTGSTAHINRCPGPVNNYWQDADWLRCTDGKWRAVEPGTFPLAHGAPARVGRLRGYGDAICAEVAEAFIKVYMETLG